MPRDSLSSCAETLLPLGTAPLGFAGSIRAIDAEGCTRALSSEELERRLLEMGFVEGAHVEIRNQGLFGHDPIAIRVGQATIALRRAVANAIRVEPEDPAGPEAPSGVEQHS